MNFFEQGIPLGKWFGITVVIHWTFLLYAGNELLHSGQDDAKWTALYLVLLFGTVLLHEFGHALSCKAVGGEAYHIVLWPLGGIAFVQPPNKAWAAFVTTFCGPLVNAILWPLFYVIFAYWATPHYIQARMNGDVSANTWYFVCEVCGYMWTINMGLLLFNLIPAYPMDGGRMLQEILWMVLGYQRSLQIAGMVGTVAGLGFIVLGTGQREIVIPLIEFHLGGSPSIMLMVIGLLCMIQSFGIYKRSQEIRTWRKN